MEAKSNSNVGAASLPVSQIGKREARDADYENLVGAKKQKIDEGAEELRIKAGATALPPPPNGKKEGEEDGDERQVITKMQKRDKGKMVIDEGDNSKQKMEVLMDSASKAPERNVENDSSVGSRDDDHDGDYYGSDFAEKPMISSEDSVEEIEETASQFPHENPKMPVTLNEQIAASRTIVIKNLSHSVERADLEDLFKDCGEIVDVRLHTDKEGRFKGFGHVDFATAEAAQKALLLNGTELLRCPLKIRIVEEKGMGKCTQNRRNWSNSIDWSNSFRCKRTQHMKVKESSEHFEEEIEGNASENRLECPKTQANPKDQHTTSKTICARNLSYTVDRADVEFFFRECGQIVDVRISMDRGRSKGFGHVEFTTTEAAQKALELNNQEMLGRPVVVDIASTKGKGEYNSNRRNWSNSFQWNGRVQSTKGAVSSDRGEEENKEEASRSHLESPKVLGTSKEHASSKTIYVKNLSYRVGRTDMENLFKECGEIVDVRLHTDHEGRLNGFGRVEFATAEAVTKALELNNTEFLKRYIKVYVSHQEKGEYTHNKSNWSSSFPKSEKLQPIKDTQSSQYCEEEIAGKAYKSHWDSPVTPTTWKDQNSLSKIINVRNLSYQVERADMENFFKECGEIVDVHLHTNRDGKLNGFGRVVFASAEAVQKALELDNTGFLGRRVQIQSPLEKGEHTHNKSNWSHSFQKSERIHPMKGTESSRHREEEIDGIGSKSHWENPNMLEGNKQNASLKTIYIRNLSYRVDPADLYNLFKTCGEIVDLHVHEGSSKGLGHIEFATSDAVQKALKLDNVEFFRRHIEVGIAGEKGEHTCNRSFSRWSNSFQKSENVQPMNGSDHARDCREESGEKDFKTPQESPNTLATPKEQIPAIKTIFVGNLPYRVEQAHLENFFKECGEIVNLRLHTDNEGRSKGYAHIEFATAKAVQKALELNNTEFMRRPITVDLARGKAEHTHNSSSWHNSFDKNERIQTLTVYVTGFDVYLPEEEIRASLEEHFGSCGELANISVPTFRESGAVKGFAHLEFKSIDSLKKALTLDHTELGGHRLSVVKAKPRRDNQRWGMSGGGVGWHSSFFS